MRTKEISGHTRMACLLGDPVEHSVSPAMHNESFRQLGIDCTYLAFRVGEEELPGVVDGLRRMDVVGFNLTMPDKNRICDLCDELTAAVAIGGAANTVVNRDGRLIAYTTDGIGFMDACKETGFSVIGEKMTLLGAGGAARAIMIQGALDGVKEISIFSRRGSRWEQTEELAERLRRETSCKIDHYDYENPRRLKAEIRSSRILVNATSVGMEPDTEATLVPDTDCFYPGLQVYDVIYSPRETKLLRQAKAAGCRTANGMYMLLYQGAAAFEIWTGQKMPVETIKEKYFRE